MKRNEMISKIKSIVNEWGVFSINEVDGEECPILSKQNKNSEVLIEKVGTYSVQCTEYVHGKEVDEYDVDYIELTDEQLTDVFRIAEQYETEQEKTWKRCQS